MSNLVTRAITGFFFALLIVGSILLGPTIQSIAFGVFLVLGLNEFSSLFKETDFIPSRFATVFVGTILYIFFVLSNLYTVSIELLFSIGFVLFFLVFLLEIWRKQLQPLSAISIFVFGIFYIVVPFVLMNRLMFQVTDSFSPLLGMIVLIWANDTFAYLFGRKLGKTPLFERISPKKTWEGTIGGILMTMVISLTIAYFTETSDLLYWIIAGIVIAPSAIFGDLLESLFKRSLKIKDSGNILPGHGGILDRFDAVLFTVPFFYLWNLIYEQTL
jgi:phosphatidate cytidylyltransferase